MKLALLVICISVTSISSTSALGAGDEAEQQIIKQIEEIRTAKTIAKEWKVVLQHFKETKSSAVADICVETLREVKNVEFKNELVAIVIDSKVNVANRHQAVQMLSGIFEILTSEDIDKLLVERDLISPVFDLACNVVLTPKQYNTVFERYTSLGGNDKVLIISFVNCQLKKFSTESFKREIAPVLREFVIECAKGAGPVPPNLRPIIAWVMANHKVTGAAEVAIQSLKDGSDRYRTNGDFTDLPLLIKTLSIITGETRGFDEKLKPEDPKNLAAVEKWFEWWESNKNDEKLKLPTGKKN
jgi:hypothetical protein